MKKKKEVQSSTIFWGYLKLFCLFAVVIFVVFVLRKWYLDNKNYELEKSIISETLVQEINQNEVYNYVRENPNAVIYIGLVSDLDCRTFESYFNSVIKERDLREEITYLNLGKEKNTSQFFDEFDKFYDTDLDQYPSIVVFKNGIVSDILEISLEDSYYPSAVEDFLDRNSVVSQ